MFSKILQYALKNILRNTFLSISSVLVLTLLMFFINILFVIHNVSSDLISSINSKLTLSLYLNEKYDNTSPEVIGLLEDIKKFSPTIVSQYKGA
jgi:cell division transport system permease protein